ncbi:hypothetical protein R5R35_007866 [Gryllus longicercus]|uniref:Uncharacterized protein n=1 Tax=Gryllus longicercus TaxID=2509291 RepID=A0AAN9VNL9_9ORTH
MISAFVFNEAGQSAQTRSSPASGFRGWARARAREGGQTTSTAEGAFRARPSLFPFRGPSQRALVSGVAAQALCESGPHTDGNVGGRRRMAGNGCVDRSKTLRGGWWN